MKRLLLLLIVLVVGLAATPVMAQNGSRVYIPFAFTANHQVLPSGVYRIQMLSERFLAFVNDKTKATERVVMVRPETSDKIATVGKLVFMSYGRHYVLKEVHLRGRGIHSALIVQPRPETVVAKDARSSGLEVAME